MTPPVASPPPPRPSAAATALLIILGVVFISLWLSAAGVWATMSAMGGLMANDSGRIDAGTHAALLLVMMVGEGLVAVAGFPAGAAIFWAGRRRLMLAIFAVLMVLGAGLQIWAMRSMFAAAA